MIVCSRPCQWRQLQIRGLRGIHRQGEEKRWPGWDVVVGIEVHAQIKSRRKLFSGPRLHLQSTEAVDSADT